MPKTFFWLFLLVKIKREICFYSFFELIVIIVQNFSFENLENDFVNMSNWTLGFLKSPLFIIPINAGSIHILRVSN